MWEEGGYFTPKIDSAKEPYTIVLPPPNSNGKLHVGHALLVAIEDLLIRWKRMQGYSALWIPGTDHAGFETQTVFEKHLKKDGKSRLDFEIRGKEKIWLFGPNGSGKSTMVKMIMGEETPTEGTISVGVNMKIGYFAQKQTHLDYEKNLLDQFIEETKCSFGDAHGLLNRFMFDRDAIRKSVKNLSPGERARYAFAIFASENYDMLILDEPTNHLDIETKEVIEESLRDFAGTLLLVSHDRYFVESIGVEKMLNLREGKLEWI